MVSLRRRRLLGLCSGNNSLATQLPLHENSSQDANPKSRQSVISNIASVLNNITVTIDESGSSNVSRSSSSKDQPSQQNIGTTLPEQELPLPSDSNQVNSLPTIITNDDTPSPSTPSQQKDKNAFAKLPMPNYQYMFAYDEEYRLYVSNFYPRRISVPHYADLDQLKDLGLDVKTPFQRQDLDTFASLREPYLDYMVKAFYANLKVTGTTLESNVNGKLMVVNDAMWLELAGLKNEGLKVDPKQFVKTKEFKKKKKKLLEFILKDPTQIIPPRILVGFIHASYRLTLWILNYILDIRCNGFSRVQDTDMYMIWLIHTGVKINWPALIAKRMACAKRNTNAFLPYASFVARIIHHFEADVKEDQNCRIQVPDASGLTPAILKLMGYKEDPETKKLFWPAHAEVAMDIDNEDAT